MRRIVALVVLALVALCAAPGLLHAQTSSCLGPVGPGGVICGTNDQDPTASPATGSAQTIYSKSVPTAFFTTGRGVQPIRLALQMTLATNTSSPGTLAFTIAFGNGPSVSIAAFTLVSGVSNMPAELVCDVYSILSTAPLQKFAACSFSYNQNTASTTDIVVRGSATGTLTNSATQTVSVTATFGTAGPANAIIVRGSRLTIGG